MTTSLQWVKCTQNVWCSLERLDLSSVKASGIYIIWHAGSPGRVVYIGQGDPISGRLSAHRNNPAIMRYAKSGTLHVTWASVPANQRDGIERYLADKWRPLIGDAHPAASPIAVNSPW